MSGLELIALVPFAIAGWKLFEKVGSQQSLIEQHEITINNQKEMLESIVGNKGSIDQPRWVSSAAAVGVVALAAGIGYKTWHLKQQGTSRPPPSYEPTPAVHEMEQCIICLENRKDTVLLPCRHLCACWPCAVHFVGDKCPTCRGDVEALQFVYSN